MSWGEAHSSHFSRPQVWITASLISWRFADYVFFNKHSYLTQLLDSIKRISLLSATLSAVACVCVHIHACKYSFFSLFWMEAQTTHLVSPLTELGNALPLIAVTVSFKVTHLQQILQRLNCKLWLNPSPCTVAPLHAYLCDMILYASGR